MVWICIKVLISFILERSNQKRWGTWSNAGHASTWTKDRFIITKSKSWTDTLDRDFVYVPVHVQKTHLIGANPPRESHEQTFWTEILCMYLYMYGQLTLSVPIHQEKVMNRHSLTWTKDRFIITKRKSWTDILDRDFVYVPVHVQTTHLFRANPPPAWLKGVDIQSPVKLCRGKQRTQCLCLKYSFYLTVT